MIKLNKLYSLFSDTASLIKDNKVYTIVNDSLVCDFNTRKLITFPSSVSEFDVGYLNGYPLIAYKPIDTGEFIITLNGEALSGSEDIIALSIVDNGMIAVRCSDKEDHYTIDHFYGDDLENETILGSFDSASPYGISINTYKDEIEGYRVVVHTQENVIMITSPGTMITRVKEISYHYAASAIGGCIEVGDDIIYNPVLFNPIPAPDVKQVIEVNRQVFWLDTKGQIFQIVGGVSCLTEHESYDINYLSDSYGVLCVHGNSTDYYKV